jgi:hypothetical protein
MEYKLLEIGDGVILLRQPKVVYNELSLFFDGSPENSTAIIETESGDSFYRELKDGRCSVPSKKLEGDVKVSVALFNGDTPNRTWKCEGLKVSKLRDGGTLIAPNDMNLPQRYVELKVESDNIRRANERITNLVKKLERKIENLLEGYDLT